MSLPLHIALVSLTSRVSQAQLAALAAACNKQMTRDYYPIWQKPTTVQAFPQIKEVPADYQKVIIKDDIGAPGALGYHTDENGQPISFVAAQRSLDDTCITVSHEIIEMRTDPFGNRLIAADVTKMGRVRILCEPCDPSEAKSYSINGLAVSDFYTPEWFDPVKSAGIRYSYMDVLAPRSIIRGGYMSFIASDGRWYQQTWFRGRKAITEGPFNWRRKDGESLRQMVDRETSMRRAG